MRIGFVVPRYAPFVGGVETHVERLATGMARLGHSVQVLTHRYDRALRPSEAIDGVRVRRFAVPIPSDNFAVSLSLWAALARESKSFDVVHAHAYHALPALWAALAPRRKLIFTPHYHGTGHSPFRKALHPVYRPLGGYIVRRANRVIAVSEVERSLLLGHFPSASSKTVVIPNGVDRELLDQSIAFDEPRRVILSAGRLESYKRVEIAPSMLWRICPRITFSASWATAQHVSRSSRGRELADLSGDRIRLMGQVSRDDLYRWFQTASVYVSLSTNEAMPVTVVETLAAGAAIVASDIPAHGEIARGPGSEAMALIPQRRRPVRLRR